MRKISQAQLKEKINAILATPPASIQSEIQSGVNEYLLIQKRYDEQKIDDVFQKTFVHFYRVRGKMNRNGLWTLLRNRQCVSISNAMDFIKHPKKPKVHLSFASKALHTINSKLPIYDRTVRVFFRLPLPTEKGYRKRRNHQEDVYNELKTIYDDRENNGLIDLAKAFDMIFPQHKNQIPVVKKIDFMIWGYNR